MHLSTWKMFHLLLNKIVCIYYNFQTFWCWDTCRWNMTTVKILACTFLGVKGVTIIYYANSDWFGVMTLSITTLSITALGILGLYAILGTNDTKHNGINCFYAECHYAECRYAECNSAECRGAIESHFCFCCLKWRKCFFCTLFFFNPILSLCCFL